MMDTQLTKRVRETFSLQRLRSDSCVNAAAEKRRRQRAEGNVADLQAHKASEKGKSGAGTHAPKEIPPGDIRVR